MTGQERAHAGTAAEVFGAFLALGLTSFGGPAAHLALFRRECVERRGWLNERDFADLVALCQCLPGPTSSQTGMALGFGRAGWPGMAAAWVGFTLPSAVIMVLFALAVSHDGEMIGEGWVHGLKLFVAAVVAQAVTGMARALCTDASRVTLALVSAFMCALFPSVVGLSVAQMLALAASGCLGIVMISPVPEEHSAPPLCYSVRRRQGALALLIWGAALTAFPIWAMFSGSPTVTFASDLYRSGALVFGGGHVVLPLLQASVEKSGMVGDADFLAGYGAAQIVPGPLFTFGGYLGAVASWPMHGTAGGAAALCLVFLPGWLILVGALPFMQMIRGHVLLRKALLGVNAAVVGMLASAWATDIVPSALHTKTDLIVAACLFWALTAGRVPPVCAACVAVAAGQWMA